MSTTSEYAGVGHAAETWVEWLARLGYATKGAVYIIIGALAVRVSLGAGGRTTGTRGALQEIAAQPFGTIMLGLVALGLCGYVLWRFIEAIGDPENKGTGLKGLALRAGRMISGLVYAGVALTAVQLILGARQNVGDNQAREWTAWLLTVPFGGWAVSLAGLIVIGIGIFQFYKAYTAKFLKHLGLSGMSQGGRRWLTRIGRFGLAARGAIFGMVGFFLVQAALHENPNDARGLDGALREFAAQPYGRWWLGVVAAGLVAYGIFMLLEGKYRHISAK